MGEFIGVMFGVIALIAAACNNERPPTPTKKGTKESGFYFCDNCEKYNYHNSSSDNKNLYCSRCNHSS